MIGTIAQIVSRIIMYLNIPKAEIDPLGVTYHTLTTRTAYSLSPADRVRVDLFRSFSIHDGSNLVITDFLLFHLYLLLRTLVTWKYLPFHFL